MKGKFDFKKISIVIDQNEAERKKGHYYIRATEDNSPIHLCDTANEIGLLFGKWLSNTIDAMTQNNCQSINMEITWK